MSLDLSASIIPLMNNPSSFRLTELVLVLKINAYVVTLTSMAIHYLQPSLSLRLLRYQSDLLLFAF